MLLEQQHTEKFRPKTKTCLYLGPNMEGMGHKYWDPATCHVIVSRNAQFFEFYLEINSSAAVPKITGTADIITPSDDIFINFSIHQAPTAEEPGPELSDSDSDKGDALGLIPIDLDNEDDNKNPPDMDLGSDLDEEDEEESDDELPPPTPP